MVHLRGTLVGRGSWYVCRRMFCNNKPATSAAESAAPKTYAPSGAFALDDAWAARVDELARHGLVGGYEWISTLQKKFASVGYANGVDLDVATQLADEDDQRDDIVDLVYRFRHTPNASDLLPSTEYAVYRTLLRHNDWPRIFRIINDPINYGIFMNEHISCLAINQLLHAGDVPGASKIATCVMQQEMFDFDVLNFLSLFALAKWTELPERVMSETIQPFPLSTHEDQYDEEEMKTMKFPFLKNYYFDNHFDLYSPNETVRKSLLWFSWNLPNDLSTSGKNELRSRIEAMLSSPEPDKVPFLPHPDGVSLLSTMIEEIFAPLLPEAENRLCEHQLNLFDEWNKRRVELIKAQVERLNLTSRLKEIEKRREELTDTKKMLFFFENRVEWEEKARETDKLFDEMQLNAKEQELTEKEYADSMFDIARRILQNRYVAPGTSKSALIDEEAEKKRERRRLIMKYGKYIPKTMHNPRRREVPPLMGKNIQ